MPRRQEPDTTNRKEKMTLIWRCKLIQNTVSLENADRGKGRSFNWIYVSEEDASQLIETEIRNNDTVYLRPQPGQRVLIDLSHVNTSMPRGMRTLVGSIPRARAIGGEIELSNTCLSVRRQRSLRVSIGCCYPPLEGVEAAPRESRRVMSCTLRGHGSAKPRSRTTAALRSCSTEQPKPAAVMRRRPCEIPAAPKRAFDQSSNLVHDL
jgi:hypothetical protein